MPKSFQPGPVNRASIYLRSSFWFVPACLLLGSVVLALGLVEVDLRMGQGLRERWPRLFAGDAEGSRSMLSAIASSMITVAGVVFSITILVLAQASTQFTSRVLRNFMRDRLNQTVLGVFVGVFTYCVLVLRTIDDTGGAPFVPSLAVLVGLMLAIVAIGFLIAFIHHISATIQVGQVARTVMVETQHAIDHMFPHADDSLSGPLPADQSPGSGCPWQPLPAHATGYIQSADADALLAFAIRHDTVVRMELPVGHFVAKGRPIAHLAMDGRVSREQIHDLNLLFSVDAYRTTDQDPAFGFRQLVDIALKGLSPGINDTTTAVTCIDYLSALLERLAPRPLAPPSRFQDGRVRVIARSPSFEQLVDLAFGQILENAAGNTVVLTRLLHMVEEVAGAAQSPARRRHLVAQVDVIEEVALASARSTEARARLGVQALRARAACA